MDKVDAERLVGFGAAEYVTEEEPIHQKEEKQPDKVTKEDKTANKRKTK